MTKYPSFSIAMATFNGAEYLGDQLDSLASQTVCPAELIVCDDQSTDATIRILREFARAAPFPVRIYQNETNLGWRDNFLKAASLCSEDWIAFCDQDDVWLPTKLEWAAQASTVRHDTTLVAHRSLIVDSELQATGHTHPSYSQYGTIARNQVGLFPTIPGHALAFKRDIITGVDVIARPPCIANTEDGTTHDAIIPLLANILGSLEVSDDLLVLHRRHGAAVTGLEKGEAVRHGVKKRIGRALRHNNAYFSRLAYAARMTSVWLLAQSHRVGGDYGQRLAGAAAVYQRAGDNLQARAQTISGRHFTDRLRAYRFLWSRKAYAGKRSDVAAFSRAGMLKDLLAVFGVGWSDGLN